MLQHHREGNVQATELEDVLRSFAAIDQMAGSLTLVFLRKASLEGTERAFCRGASISLAIGFSAGGDSNLWER